MRAIRSWERTILRHPFKRGRESSTILLELDQKKESTPERVRTLFMPQASSEGEFECLARIGLEIDNATPHDKSRVIDDLVFCRVRSN